MYHGRTPSLFLDRKAKLLDEVPGPICGCPDPPVGMAGSLSPLVVRLEVPDGIFEQPLDVCILARNVMHMGCHAKVKVQRENRAHQFGFTNSLSE